METGNRYAVYVEDITAGTFTVVNTYPTAAAALRAAQGELAAGDGARLLVVDQDTGDELADDR